MTRSKYGAIPVVIDGIRFASTLEGQRYQQLKIMERAGEIAGMVLQKHFPLMVNDVEIGEYVADFVYRLPITKAIVIEDAKGFLTPVCRWKLKHMAAQGHPVTLWPERKKKGKK